MRELSSKDCHLGTLTFVNVLTGRYRLFKKRESLVSFIFPIVTTLGPYFFTILGELPFSTPNLYISFSPGLFFQIL